MNKLYKLILELEQKLDEEQCIINLKNAYINLKKDKKIIKEIEKYNISQDEGLRKILIKNEDIRKVKRLEADLNYIILEINQGFSSLIDDNRSSKYENN